MKTLALLGLTLLSAAAQADTLFDNGPAVDADGYRISTGYNGAVAASSFDAAVAENFTVGSTGWLVTDLNLYGWTEQNTPTEGGTSLFTFTSVTWSIVSGDINEGTVVATDTTFVTNGGLVGYNVRANDLTTKRQAIWDIQVDLPDVQLAAGDYWLTWSYTTDAFVGAQAPIAGPMGGDAQSRFRSSVYFLAGPADTGVSFPVLINGSVSAVPEPATAASILAGLGILGATLRRKHCQARQSHRADAAIA